MRFFNFADELWDGCGLCKIDKSLQTQIKPPVYCMLHEFMSRAMRAMPPNFSGIIFPDIALSDLHKSFIMLRKKTPSFPGHPLFLLQM